MRKFLLTLLIAACLAGCATTARDPGDESGLQEVRVGGSTRLRGSYFK